MTVKPASSMSADDLWGTITGALPRERMPFYCVLHGYRQSDHSACVVNLCPHCARSVRNWQIENGDAFPIDERGPDDGKYAHRECAQGARYEP